MSSPKRILLVEDDEQVNGYLVQLLTKAGWQVTPVLSATGALDALTAQRFDVILSDLDLGRGLSGIDLLECLPKKADGTPFVMLTAHGNIDRCRAAFQSGAADFIEKPSLPAELLGALERASSRHPNVSERVMGEAHPDDVAHRRLLVGRALQLISRHCTDIDFSVAELARGLGVTAEHLARNCRDRLDRSPLELIHAARIVVGTRLLANRALSIYEVAWGSGYKATKEFDIWFRRIKGVTPSQWRTGASRLS